MREQHGLINIEQLADLGLNAAARRRRVKAGLLVPVLPGVFRVSSADESWRQFVQAAWMWLRDRGVISHVTSATLMRLVESESYPVELSTPLSSLRAPDERISIHRVKSLAGRDIRLLDEMKITTPVRTVFDLAGSLPPNRFEHVLDEARRRHLVAERPLRELLNRCARQGRSGVKTMRRVLDSGELQLPVPGSRFERNFIQFLDRRRLPEAQRQVVIKDKDGVFVARVDFAYPNLKIAIECDGRKHHFGVDDWERDTARNSRLAALGWLVIHVSWHMLVNEPDEVERLIRNAIGQPALL
jgi:very-short-patch-repair endonuclease